MRFNPGKLVMTSNALNTLNPLDVLAGLARHLKGDWGELDEEDKHLNEVALEQDLRLLSKYRDRHGEHFYIITEHDRSYTTIMLVSDY